MMLREQLIKILFLIIFILAVCFVAGGCDKTVNARKGANIPMKTYFIGRFSIALPKDMKLAVRTASLRYVEIDEIIWPNEMAPAEAWDAEWNRFMSDIKKLAPHYTQIM